MLRVGERPSIFDRSATIHLQLTLAVDQTYFLENDDAIDDLMNQRTRKQQQVTVLYHANGSTNRCPSITGWIFWE